MNVGERIRKLRKENNWTLDELAKKIDSSPQTVHKYETNIITNIPSDKIEKIADICGVSPAYIMGWTNNPQMLTDNYDENVQYLEKNGSHDLVELYTKINEDHNIVMLVEKARQLEPQEVEQVLRIIDTFKRETIKNINDTKNYK